MAPAHERRLYGHRGVRGPVPENTVPAFARALQDGANALETDVRVTADGVVVVSHDPDGRRLAKIDRRIADCTVAEVRAWRIGIPTLDEVLASFPKIRINVDIKPADVSSVAPVIATIKRHDAQSRVTLASFHGPVARAVRDAAYRGERSLPPFDIVRLRLTPWLLSRSIGHAVQVPTQQNGLRLDTPAFIARCHGRGLRVDYWVVNEPEEAQRLLAAGADGIITDDPARIAPVMWG